MKSKPNCKGRKGPNARAPNVAEKRNEGIMKRHFCLTVMAVLVAGLPGYAAATPLPVISGVSVTGVTTSSATISWKTYFYTTSQIAYGTTIGYGSLTPLDPALVNSHSQTLTGLMPYTLYHFQVRSTSGTGTPYLSGDFSFATAANSVPGMITGVSVSGITGTSAVVQWTTSVPSDSHIEFGLTASFGSSPWVDSTPVLMHSVPLSGLNPNSLYYYRVWSVTATGDMGSSDTLTFRTGADDSTPIFSGISASNITSDSASITWMTSSPTTSQVEYGATINYGSLTPPDGALVTAHGQSLSGLVPDTPYHFRVRSVDIAGNLFVSNDYTFRTAPIDGWLTIDGVTSSLISSTSAIITWSTSAAADSLVEYGITTSYGYTTSPDPSAVTSHSQTLEGLVPDTLYHFRVKSTAGAGNSAISGDYTFTTSQITLYYPQVNHGRNEYTGIALSDLDTNAANVRFTAFDGLGNRMADKSASGPTVTILNSGAQLPIIDDQIFGPGITDRLPPGWREIDSSTSKLAGLFLAFDSSLTFLDGAAITHDLLTSLVFTEIGNHDFNRILLSNPNPETALVSINLMKSDGTVRNKIQTTIPGYETFTADLGVEIFSGISTDPSDYIGISSSIGLIPYEFFGSNTADRAILAGQDSSQGSSSIYSPQYVVGGPYRSTLSIVNLDSAPGTLTLTFYDDSGDQIGITKTIPIASNGKIFVSDPEFFQSASASPLTGPIQGYVKITSDGVKLTGNVVYSSEGTRAFVAALPLVTTLLQSSILGQVASNLTYFTGLSMLNPGGSEAGVRMDLYDSSGQLQSSLKQTIAGRHRISRLLTEYFPSLIGQDVHSGYIRIISDKAIACFGVFGTNELSVLSAIPVQPMP